MTQGKVTRIVEERGFGFIQAEDGNEYFFHRSAVPGGFEALTTGTTVEFTPEKGDKGPRAANVTPA